MPQEALRTLGLASGATADEIKQAYRDLVKVWHPDRFGSDARLRAKAEDHLKQINAAYRSLEISGFRPPPMPESQPASQPTYPTPNTRRTTQPARSHEIGLYTGCALLLAGMAVFVVRQLGSAPANVQSRPVVVPPSSRASSVPIKSAQRYSTWEPARSDPPSFQVWSLSQADSDRMQLACSNHAAGSVAYRNCIAVQLRALRGSSPAPQNASMNTGEREAAEAHCASAKQSGRSPAYIRCLNQQVAALSAETIRPDLSVFNPADRDSMQAACSGARHRGTVDYDQCLTRFARAVQTTDEPAR